MWEIIFTIIVYLSSRHLTWKYTASEVENDDVYRRSRWLTTGLWSTSWGSPTSHVAREMFDSYYRPCPLSCRSPSALRPSQLVYQTSWTRRRATTTSWHISTAYWTRFPSSTTSSSSSTGLSDSSIFDHVRYHSRLNPSTPPTVAIRVQLQSTRHLVPDRVKPSFVIFDIRTLWRIALRFRVSGCQKLQMTA